MLRSFRLFRKTKARYHTIESAVHKQIIDAAEDQGIQVDDDQLTGRQSARVFDRKYDWEINSASDHYVVVEKQYISTGWFLLFGVMLGAGIAGISVPFPEKLLTIATMFALGGLWVRPLLAPSPIDATIAANQDYRSLPAATIVLMVTIPLIVLTILAMGFALTITPDFWPLTFVLALTVSEFYVLYRRQTALLEFHPDHLPHMYELISAYLAHIQIGVIPASALIAFHSEFHPRPPYGSLAYLPFMLIAGFVLWGMHRLLTRQRAFTYHEFREGGETIQRPARQFTVSLLLGVAAYGMLAVLLLTLKYYAGFVAPVTPLAGVTVVVAIVPILYLPTGIFLQITTFVRETVGLFRHSTPTSIETPVDIDADTRVVATDRHIVGSYSLGLMEYIFISEPVIEELTPMECGAILAHEEGHLRHHDALISFFIPLVGSLLLIGKNVLYTVLDFRRREFAADAYAAEKVGQDTLRRTLQRSTAAQDAEIKVRSQFGVAPTFLPFATAGDPDILDRYFGSFFGNFALTEAHPTTEERITRLGEQDQT